MLNLKLQNYHSKSKKGFTLIEILIASYIFLVVVIVGTAIFSSAIGARMKAAAFWETQQEARYAMEKIVKLIRDENVKGFRIPPDEKALVLCKEVDCGLDDLSYRIYWSWFSVDHAIHLVKYEPDFSITQLTSSDVEVTGLNFEGYRPTSGSDRQPYIRITMTVRNAEGERQIEQDTLTLKTAVSLRTYGYKYEY